ncbi:9442_t:CDS:2 [Entrophospora sp. SA101]|nr:9442_t:CDS:2 [Entrophospora sp. SA101]
MCREYNLCKLLKFILDKSNFLAVDFYNDARLFISDNSIKRSPHPIKQKHMPSTLETIKLYFVVPEEIFDDFSVRELQQQIRTMKKRILRRCLEHSKKWNSRLYLFQ